MHVKRLFTILKIYATNKNQHLFSQDIQILQKSN